MTSPTLDDAPAVDEIEVSVFGPGVGESVVVHLGDGEWMIVDSCRERKRRRAAALLYLERIGVDPATQVKTVVATHWDSDHIRALSEVVECCESASFWCSAAVRSTEFDALLDLIDRRPDVGGLLEIARIVACRRRRLGEGLGTPRFANGNSLIVERPPTAALPRRAVYGLSPSERSQMLVTDSVRSVFEHPDEFGRRVQLLSSNDTSVVLLVVVGEHAMLLGADLENSTDPARGWRPAVERARELGVTSSLVKVPHHGAPNGHAGEMWHGTLCRSPAAAVTPYFSGRTPRPQAADRERIRTYTERAYLTTDRPEPTDQASLLACALPANAELRSIEGEVGHVRWRRQLGGSDWQVALDAPACHI
jgi:hypothetical protein